MYESKDFLLFGKLNAAVNAQQDKKDKQMTV
jgi:hypothetical protein